MDIYTRVRELATAKKNRISPKKFFCSEEYAVFLKRKIQNIISGSFHELRRQGFNVAEQEEKKLIASINVNAVWDPNSEDTAYCEQGSFGYTIYINTGSNIVMKAGSLEAMHWCALGLLYHEIGHLLYTDFPSSMAWARQMEKGRFFPKIPVRANTVDGIGLQTALQDENMRKPVLVCGAHISNCIEDGYIEEEIRSAFPGKGKSALASVNDILLEGSMNLEKADQNKKITDIEKIFSQILLYSKFGEMDLGNYNGKLLDVLYEAVDIIDDVRGNRDPLARLNAVNEILCLVWKYIEKDVANQPDNTPKSQQQDPDQNGSQGKGQNGSQSSGAGTSQTNGSGASSGSLVDKLNKIARQINKSGKDSNGTHGSLADPNKAMNAGANRTVATSSTDAGGNSTGKSGSSGSLSSGDVDMSAAIREVNNIKDQISQNSATQQAEKERTQEMNNEGRNIDLSALGIHEEISVCVERAAKVSEANKAAYEESMKTFSVLSKDLQRDIKRILKDRREGGKRKNLFFGKRLEVMSILHEDGKYFSRNKLPTETPRLGVGVLIDQSGSTSGQLINAAMLTSLIIEDFCRQLDIPHIINGYTTGAGNCKILSYAEPNEIDASNRYRITGMAARGGTPTKAAMAYMLKRMQKLPVDIRLIIVITDGQSADNGLYNGEREITTLIKNAKKNKTIVVAAGIGDDRESVKEEFGENFMDISHLQDMPVQLIELIKANLWV